MSSRWWVIVLLGLGCVTPVAPPPPEPPPPPPIVVPDGCLALQDGAWVHASDPSFRYAALDDGGTLTLAIERLQGPDAGFVPRRFRDAGVEGDAPPPKARKTPDAGVLRLDGGADGGADAGAPDAGAPLEADDAGVEALVHLTLARTPAGFVGHVTTTFRHPAGRTCEVRFPTTVLACADGGLTLETDTAAAVGDACQPPARPQGLTREVHTLVRPRGP